jgi:hypothetical protein
MKACHKVFCREVIQKTKTEILIDILILAVVASIDLGITKSVFASAVSPMRSETVAKKLVLIFNFSESRYFVFPEPISGPCDFGRLPPVTSKIVLILLKLR